MSSGEKIIISFVFCAFYSVDARQIISFPKILLLDEVDAPLHPSMCKRLIDIITKVIVQEYGIKVIATTHSPTMLALSPESSLYAMVPSEPGLTKVSKGRALNILTIGVPTLSIDFEGRKQVFVEDNNDAKIYQSLFDLLKSVIGSERSLEFISTGIRSKNGSSINTGCKLVMHLVNTLRGAGNQSVFGIVDWDNEQKSSEYIYVLTEFERDGLENVILDPLLIAALIVRQFPDHRADIGCAETTWIDFCQGPEFSLQKAVDQVISRVIGQNKGDALSKYTGFELKVDQRYLRMDDHQLADKLLEIFPYLKSITREAPNKSAKLMDDVIRFVVSEKLSFLPLNIESVFRKVLNS